MSCEGGGCSCGCDGGAHTPGCPSYRDLVGTDIGIVQGDGCGADELNAPASVGCGSLGDAVQELADLGASIVSEAGLSPYRVFLVWEKQTPEGEFVDVLRIELQPAEVYGLLDTQVVIGAGGRRLEGAIQVRRISPRQVSEDDLMGNLHGRAWDGDGERFFYEVVDQARCEGKAAPARQRFTPLSMPERRVSRRPVGYLINLTAQSVARGRHGEDRTTAIGEQPEQAKWAALRR